MKFLRKAKRYTPEVGAVVTALLPVLTPPVQQYIMDHPSLAAGLGATAMVLYRLLPSPLYDKPQQ